MGGTAQLLVFQVDDRRFGLPLASVRQVIRAVDAAPIPQAPPNVLGACDFHGTIVPLFDLRGRLGIGDRPIGLNDYFIIADTRRRTVAVRVDGAAGVIERSAEETVPVERIVDRFGPVAGILPLSDGLLMIHDLDRFLSAEQEEQLDVALSAKAGHGN